MQASQRILDNHALSFAVEKANEKKLPLIVFFGITDSFPDANYRHYYFMLQGLREIQNDLEKLNISFIIRHISPEKGAIQLSSDASIIIVDCGYLRIQRKWRDMVSSNISCPCVQVESDVIVPVEYASNKEEYSAATFRPKISSYIKNFINPIKPIINVKKSFQKELETITLKNIKNVINSLKIDKKIKPSSKYSGGADEALKHLDKFIECKLSQYPEDKNDPIKNNVSNLSPYLHFGQISPLTIVLKLKKIKNIAVEAFLEELIIRRELSMNFVYYNNNYDSYQALPNWCKQTLSDHLKDKREYNYTLEELEQAKTHDPYWNAAQKQMVIEGKMHGYMRMYWGKKIIEWTSSPEKAYKIAIYLNNKYEIDGRDTNGYTGVAWCFGKHDRPWLERPIFGKIRYMNANGLKRKFDIESYVKKYNE